jgi:hypothetical protein
LIEEILAKFKVLRQHLTGGIKEIAKELYNVPVSGTRFENETSRIRSRYVNQLI